MSFSTSSKENMSALKYALEQMEPGDFILAKNDTFDNKAIGLGSQCPYGHAILYMGEVGGAKSCLEMPIKMGPTSTIFRDSRCEKAMFVHCKKLKAKKREVITKYAQAYYDLRWDDGILAYDLGAVVQGAGSVLIGNTMGPVAGLVSDQAERSVRAFAESPNAVLNDIIINYLGNYPALSCAGLIGWSHAQAGHLIDDAFLSFPHTLSPRAIWDAVRANPDRFEASTYEFA